MMPKIYYYFISLSFSVIIAAIIIYPILSNPFNSKSNFEQNMSSNKIDFSVEKYTIPFTGEETFKKYNLIEPIRIINSDYIESSGEIYSIENSEISWIVFKDLKKLDINEIINNSKDTFVPTIENGVEASTIDNSPITLQIKDSRDYNSNILVERKNEQNITETRVNSISEETNLFLHPKTNFNSISLIYEITLSNLNKNGTDSLKNTNEKFSDKIILPKNNCFVVYIKQKEKKQITILLIKTKSS